MSLSTEELERHKRHILLKEIGGPGVQKLRGASVSLVGAGALGGPCALYLAAAGVGRIEIWDDDLVDRSNLQRQVQFGDAEIGQSKADCLTQRLRAINPSTEVVSRRSRWSENERLSGDVLIDASDNFGTRFALNRVAHASSRVLVHGAAAGWTGQASVFASGIDPAQPCYQCWVPESPPDAEACDEVGVVGALTGIIGTTMALEVVKQVTGAGEPLTGRLLLVSGLDSGMRMIKLRKDPVCPVCGSGAKIDRVNTPR